MWGWLNGITDKLASLWESIKSIPELILEGLKNLFVPDPEYIKNEFEVFIEELKMKFSVDYTAFSNLFNQEAALEDVYTDYSINGVGTLNLKIFDSKYFVQVVTAFRPYIRGFLVLMMLLYHIKQLVGFFGYDSGVVTGRTESISSAKADQNKGKYGKMR